MMDTMRREKKTDVQFIGASSVTEADRPMTSSQRITASHTWHHVSKSLAALIHYPSSFGGVYQPKTDTQHSFI